MLVPQDALEQCEAFNPLTVPKTDLLVATYENTGKVALPGQDGTLVSLLLPGPPLLGINCMALNRLVMTTPLPLVT